MSYNHTQKNSNSCTKDVLLLKNDNNLSREEESTTLLNSSNPSNVLNNTNSTRNSNSSSNRKKPKSVNSFLSDEDEVIELIEKIGFCRQHFLIFLATCCITFIEGMQFTLLSTTIIPMEGYFHTTVFELLVVSAVLFLGVGLGSILIGKLSQTFGRISVLNSCILLLNVFSILCIFTKSIILFSIFRFIVGFALGIIVPLTFNILCEFLPTKNRSTLLVIAWCPFGAGNILNLLLIIFFMPNYESKNLQKILIGSACATILPSLIYFILIKDSPRNMILDNKEREAIKLFEEMAKDSGNEIGPLQRIKVINYFSFGGSRELNHSFSALFKDRFFFITSNLTIMFFLASALFYGPILIYSPTMTSLSGSNNTSSHDIVISNIVSCLIGSSLVFLSGVLSEIQSIGLKKTSLLCYFFGLIISTVMIFYMNNFEYYMSCYIAITGAGFNTCTTIASTIYPTKIRDYALGFLYFVLRCGGFLSQFIFLGFFKMNLMLPYYILLGFTFLIIVNISFVAETTGMPLDKEVSEENETKEVIYEKIESL